VGFAPDGKLSYDPAQRAVSGVKYHGSMGPPAGFGPLCQRWHILLPLTILDFGRRWNCSFGIAAGAAAGTDQLLAFRAPGGRFGGSQPDSRSPGPALY
jgi:hypothetical protein